MATSPNGFAACRREDKEFVVHANPAKGEARESSLARQPSIFIGQARTAARNRRMLDGLAQR